MYCTSKAVRLVHLPKSRPLHSSAIPDEPPRYQNAGNSMCYGCLAEPLFKHCCWKQWLWANCFVTISSTRDDPMILAMLLSLSSHYKRARFFWEWLSLYDNRLIYMPCYTSHPSCVILLFLYNNRSIYTSCYMSHPSSMILHVKM
jgi:hypothetical protein